MLTHAQPHRCCSPQMGSVDDNGSGGSYAYRASKSALNIGKGWAAVMLRDAREGATGTGCLSLYAATADDAAPRSI